LEEEIKLENEFIRTTNSFKNTKSPGVDNINTELVKNVFQLLLYRFLNEINICWQYEHNPEE
jgi:hypothetical protein